MKKILLFAATALLSLSMFAAHELVDFSKITLDSWGGSGTPEVSMADQEITIKIIATPGWQWGNQVKIILGNVAEAGLSKDKEYKLTFTATASTDDCSGVTVKMFDNNQLFYTNTDYLAFSTAPFEFDSKWLKLDEEADVATNGMIVMDFGWDPPQTITIRNLSLLERDLQTEWTIGVSANNEDFGSVSGGGMYEDGETATLIATSNEGYQFVSWNDGNTDNPRVVTVTEDVTYIANFGVKMCTLSAVPNNAAYGMVSGSGTFTYGTQLSVVAIPNDGYEFSRWSDGNTDNPRVVTVTEDVTYIANFGVKMCTLSAVPNNAAYGMVSGSGTFTYGTQLSIVAIPNEHYEFSHWSDGATDNPRQIVVISDVEYRAIFTPKSYQITALSNNSAYGVAYGSGLYAYGSQVGLTALANEGYEFISWSDGNTSNPRVVTVSGEATYTAYFTTKTFTISTVSNNNSYGTASGGGSFVYGSQIEISATPSAGYQFNGWSDGNTDNPRQVVVNGDVTYTALFGTKICELVVKTNDILGGAVFGGGTFVYGTQVTISASENSGYTFAKWSDGATYNPYKFTIVDDTELIAYFFKAQAEEVTQVDEVEVTPQENSATIVWPQVDNTYTYSLIIWADEAQTEKVCKLTFDASGRLTNIDFSKKAHDAYTQEAQVSGFSFTVTGLESNTQYFYKLAAKDSENQEISSEEGSFKTTKSAATDVDAIVGADSQVVKLIQNGHLYILRDGKTYNAQGARVE